MFPVVRSWHGNLKHLVSPPLRTMSYPLRRRIWQRLNNPLGTSFPVFLVGCGRSGTSMLVSQLARSWQIDLYNEGDPRAFEHWRLREHNTICKLVQESYANVVLFKPILDTHLTQELLVKFKEAKAIFASRCYNDVINSSLKKFGVDNWKERVNRWMHTDFAEFSAKPPPLETCERVRRLWQPTLSPESATALYWLFYNRLYYDLGMHTDCRVHLIQYENIVSSPHRQFNRLCQFLSISLIPEMTDGVFSSSIARQAQPGIDPDIKDECDQLWQQLREDASSTG